MPRPAPSSPQKGRKNPYPSTSTRSATRSNPEKSRRVKKSEESSYPPDSPSQFLFSFSIRPPTPPRDNEGTFGAFQLNEPEQGTEEEPERTSGRGNQAHRTGDSDKQPTDPRRSSRLAERTAPAERMTEGRHNASSLPRSKISPPSGPFPPTPGTSAIPNISHRPPTIPTEPSTFFDPAFAGMPDPRLEGMSSMPSEINRGVQFPDRMLAFNLTPDVNMASTMGYSRDPSLIPGNGIAMQMQGMQIATTAMPDFTHSYDSTFSTINTSRPVHGHRIATSMPSTRQPSPFSPQFPQSRMMPSSPRSAGHPSPLRNIIPLQPQYQVTGSPNEIQHLSQNVAGMHSPPSIPDRSFQTNEMHNMQPLSMHPYAHPGYPAAEQQQPYFPQGALQAGAQMHVSPQRHGGRHAMSPQAIMVPSPTQFQHLMEWSPGPSASPGSGSGSRSLSSGPGSADSSPFVADAHSFLQLETPMVMQNAEWHSESALGSSVHLDRIQSYADQGTATGDQAGPSDHLSETMPSSYPQDLQLMDDYFKYFDSEQSGQPAYLEMLSRNTHVAYDYPDDGAGVPVLAFRRQ